MKWVIRIVGLLVVLVLVAAVVVYLLLNGIVKSAVQTAGQDATGVPTELAGVNVSPFTGAATLTDFRLGQPEGFDGEVLFSLGEADVKVQPTSLLGDTVRVPKVHLDGTHLTVSFANGQLNLQKLMEQIRERAAPAEETDPEAPGKNVIIDDLRITNTTVSGSVALPGLSKPLEINDLQIADIQKQGIGSDGTGVKLEDAIGIILETIMINATQGISSNYDLGDVRALAEDALGDVEERANQAVDEAGDRLREGIGGLLGGNRDDAE
jgi:hypothetical protein